MKPIDQDESVASIPTDIYQRIIESSNDAVMITKIHPDEGDGPEIVYLNDAFERLTGYTRAAVLGKNPSLLHGPGTDFAARERIRSAHLHRKPCSEKLLNYNKSGQPRWFDMSMFPLADTDGHGSCFATVARDVTEDMDRAQDLSASFEKSEIVRDKIEQVVREKDREIQTSQHRAQISDEL